MDKKAIIEALRDKPQLGRPDIKGIPRRVTDAVNRNIATLLGTPVDTVTNAINLGIAGVGTLGHKLGLVSTPPNVIENPIGGSEWFGQQMEQRGMVSPERNTYNEVMAGLLMPAATTRAAKTLFNVEQQAARNIAAPRTLNTPGYGGQRGAVGFVYPQQEALDIAQRNAAKPVSEGGLGLPPNNTAMDRAKAMGYPMDLYTSRHSPIGYVNKLPKPNTPIKNAEKIKAELEQLGIPVRGEQSGTGSTYLSFPGNPYKIDPAYGGGTSVPIEQMRFSTHSKRADKIPINQPDDQFVADVFPKYGNSLNEARSAIQSMIEKGGIRSRFAAFDPARINESDLLGYADPRLLGLLGLGTAGGIGAYNYMQGK